MNKDLKHRVFDIPQEILDRINHMVVGLNGEHINGVNRAKKLLLDKTVKYGQLKRIIHDIQTMDKVRDRTRYELCGGDAMERWSKQYLKGERDLISNRKDSKKDADSMVGMTGERKNSHLKKHKKKPDFLPPTNLIKSNSHKTSVSPLTSFKLFEEVQKIKKLINH
jgi:hypothetical protein